MKIDILIQELIKVIEEFRVCVYSRENREMGCLDCIIKFIIS